MSINFGSDLSNIFGTSRFGQNAISQGRDITSSLAAGFINRKKIEDKAEEERKALLAGLLGTAGAVIGSQFGSIGTAIGAESGKALLGKADPSNILAAKISDEKLKSTEYIEGGKMLLSKAASESKILENSRIESIKLKSDYIKQGFDVSDIAKEGYQKVDLPNTEFIYVKDIKDELNSKLNSAKDISSKVDILRKEVNPYFSKYKDVESANIKITESLKQDSAMSDVASIFSYMKILDPGSTVREGEFANIENAKGVPATVRNYFNRALTGEKLTVNQRKELKESSEKLFKAEKDSFNEVKTRYTNIAIDMGIGEEINKIFGDNANNTKLIKTLSNNNTEFNTEEEAIKANLKTGTRFKIGNKYFIKE